MKKLKLGFTMIELLIVIAVLGVLAVAVLAAINPIEQINRGRDTGSRSDAEQLLSAIDRYYTTQEIYPWQADEDSTAVLAFGEVVDVEDGGGTPADFMLAKLAAGGTAELKQSFVNRLEADNYNNLYIYHRGTAGDSTYVCFIPQSGSFTEDATDRCTDGLPDDLNDIVATLCNNDIDGDGTNDYASCLP